MPNDLGLDPLRVAIEIDGATMEEEARLAECISDSLAERGFTNVFVVATETLYTDKGAVDKYNQETTLSKEQPIITSTSTAIH